MTVRVRAERGGKARHLHNPSWHRTERSMGITNSRGGLPGTRGCARAQRMSARSGRPCMHACAAAASPAQSQHMTRTASRSGATHTELGPPRPHASDARDAREHTVRGPRSARAQARPTREGGVVGSGASG